MNIDELVARLRHPFSPAPRYPLRRFTAYYDPNRNSFLSDREATQLGLPVGWEDFKKAPCIHQHAYHGFCIACGKDLTKE